MRTMKTTSQTIKAPVVDLLNHQIEQENHAAYSYLAMATWADVQGYKGSALFLYHQAQEERAHMLKIMHYLTQKGIQPTMPMQSEVATQYASLHELFKKAYTQEMQITQAIHRLVSLTLAEQDFATFAFLQWFVQEQSNEEDQMRDILELFDIIEPKGLGLYTIDQKIKERAPHPAN